MRPVITRCTACLLSASMIAIAAPAWAQSDSSEKSALTLDEIIVTAQKREENQQKVPISITTATSEFMDSNDIRTLEDLNGSIPGLFTTGTVAYNTAPISVRGIGGSNGSAAFFNDAPVATYVDGVYVARSTIPTTNLQDVDSIQVLRGPQGTLYGRNSTAGAILITTKRATDEFEAELRAGYARFNEFNIGAVVSGPISENLSARASIGYSDKPGFGVNIADNNNAIGGSQDFTARLSLNFEPSDAVSFDLIGEFYSRRAQPALIAISSVGTNGTADPNIVRPDLDQVLEDRLFDFPVANRSDSDTVSLTLLGEWDLGELTLNSVTGYRDWDFIGEQDSDSTSVDAFTNRAPIRSRQFSQEFRLASADDKRLSWILGAYYLNEDLDIEVTINRLRSFGGAGFRTFAISTLDTDALALFGDGTFDITDKFSLTLGWRYSYETKKFSTIRDDIVINGGVVGGVMRAPGEAFRSFPLFNSEETFEDFSPRVVLDYQVNDDVFLYASYSQGFKSGGFNTFGATAAYGPESTDSFEVGYKSELMDNRVRLNASVFYNDYSGLQIRTPIPAGGAIIDNIGVAEIKGAELEVSAAIAEGFTVSGNIAYLDAEIVEGVIVGVASNVGVRTIGGPVPTAPLDLSGNRLTRSPKWQTYLNATYEKPVGDYLAAFSATFKYQDSVFYAETHQDVDVFTGEAWSEVDLRLVISDPDDSWQVAFYGQNVFNNRRVSYALGLGGFPAGAISEPAKWGVETIFRF